LSKLFTLSKKLFGYYYRKLLNINTILQKMTAGIILAVSLQTQNKKGILMKKFFLAVAMVLFSQVHAGTILSPTAVVSSNMGEYDSVSYGFHNMYDQSGLSTPFVSGTTNFDTFVSNGVTHIADDSRSWLSRPGVFNGYVTFDLGGIYDVTKLVLWNGASGISASPNNFSFATSLTSDFSLSTSVGTFTGQGANYDATVYDVTESNARYVRMNIGGNFGNGCCTAIGEIAFDVGPPASTNVPEPTSVALLGLGLIAAFAGARRKL
jgi:hypothetical protein